MRGWVRLGSVVASMGVVLALVPTTALATTVGAASGAPVQVATSNATATSLDVSWAAPVSDGGAAITDYSIEYRKVGELSWNSITHAPSTSTTITVTGLTPSSTYVFRVAALNTSGMGRWSQSEPTIVTGAYHSCAVLQVGVAKCWGWNSQGQLGDGNTGGQSATPVSVSGIDGTGPSSTAVSLTAGQTFSCAQFVDSSTRCWGGNTSGGLGNGSLIDSDVPVSVIGLEGLSESTTAVSIDAGGNHTCGAMGDGAVKCWGQNQSGELGIGTSGGDYSTIQDVVGLDGLTAATSGIAVSSGFNFSCALLDDGRVNCWGDNTVNQLGDGTTNSSFAPVSVLGIDGSTPATTAVAISSGNEHSCAVMVNNTVMCWGSGLDGQLGDGGRTNSGVPVAVDGFDGLTAGSSVASINLGNAQSCAVLFSGSERCWGGNGYGQLSDGSVIGSAGQIVVPGTGASSAGTTGSQIAGGYAHSCGMFANGAMNCWGWNFFGQLGDGTTALSATPVTVTGLDGANASQSVASRGVGTTLALQTPSVPLHVSTSGATLTSLYVTWEAPVSDSGFPITDYTIEYRKVGTPTWSNFPHAPSTSTFATVTGLDSAATYEFRIAAVNIHGASEWTRQLTAFAVGFQHTCALVSDGSAACWGRNSSGQVGNGGTSPVGVPTPVTGVDGSTPAKTAVSIVAGEKSSCVLRADGAVMCWGGNDSGQLGNGTNANSSTPVAVSGFDGLTPATSAVSISMFGTHVCALRAEGAPMCWGGNMDGQLGDGTRTDSNIPVAVSGLDGLIARKTAVSITTGSYNSCVVLANAAVKCWGNNTFGQLGDGTQTRRLTPTFVVGLKGNPGVVQVSAGRASTCAVLRDGSAVCWGENADGRLGDGSNTRQLTPVGVVGLDGSTLANSVQSISVGGTHACANHIDGSAVCWGDNTFLQLGGHVGDSNVPVPVTGIDASTTAAGAVLLTTGELHTCAILGDGSAVCWGEGTYGQLGDGSTNSTATPVAVTGLDGSTASSRLPWNLGTGSTLAPPPGGSGPGAPRHVMTSRPSLTSLDVSWLPPFDDGGSAITDYLIEYRRVGTDSWTTASHAPSTLTTYRKTGLEIDTAYEFRVAAVTANGSGPWNRYAMTIAVGGSYSCLVRADGAVTCWGGNTSGQLGDNSTTPRLTPVVVSGIDGTTSTAKAEFIASAATHSCALMTTGAIRCWGDNSFGQLGDGSLDTRLVPVTVSGIDGSSNANRAESVNVGGDESCAIMVDGSARCWGRNDYGQIGDGTTTNSSTPVEVGDSDGSQPESTVTSIALGEHHACAAYEDGSARCWGANDRGQLGDGTVVARLDPVVVSGLDGATSATAVQQIAADRSNTCAVLADASLMCWGANSSGQIGDNSLTDRSTPTPVTGLDGAAASRSVAVVSVGDANVCTTMVDGVGLCWGANNYRQLGNYDGASLVPARFLSAVYVGSLGPFGSMATGGDTACVVLASSSVFCTGRNNEGQLGNGYPQSWGACACQVSGLTGGGGAASAFIGRGMGVTVITPPGSPLHVVARGGISVDDPIIVSWDPPVSNGGRPVTGYRVMWRPVGAITWDTIEWATEQLSIPVYAGSPTTTYEFRVAAINDVGLGEWNGPDVKIAAGGSHSCAVEIDGSATCWGSNSSGELGDGTLVSRDTPVSVDGLDGSTLTKTVVEIATGNAHSCAALLDGSAVCWGDNSSGQLGNNSLVNSSAPVAVTNLDGSGPDKSVVSIVAGGYSTCAVLGDGSTRCWGDNSFGQLGNGTTTATSIPSAVPELDGLTSDTASVVIALSGNFACAILRDNSAKCWGSNADGELGNGLNVGSSSPVAVAGLDGLTPATMALDISVGDTHACVVVGDGSAKCWGNNDYGKLGDGNVTVGPVNYDSSVPVAVSGIDGSSPATAAVSISAGGAFSCVLVADGTAKCWGAGGFGQLGVGSISTASPVPVEVTGFDGSVPSKRLVAISAGIAHTCAVSADELAWCWGSSASGQLGYGSLMDAPRPVAASGISSGSISAAQFGTSGAGNPGLVLDASTSNATQNSVDLSWSAPQEDGGVPIVNYRVRFKEVGTKGWLTHSHTQSTATNLTVTGLIKRTSYVFQISAVNSAGNVGPWVRQMLKPIVGPSHSCGVSITSFSVQDMALQCWGRDDFGALGNGVAGDSLMPAPVTGIDGGGENTSPAGGVGAGFSCFQIGESSYAKCWGLNSSGQLGDGTTTNRPDPVGVLDPDGVTSLKDATSITTGRAHGCALLINDAEIVCWGSNSHGQLGNGTTSNSLTASVVSGLSDSPHVVSAGADFTCAIDNYAVKCWGANDRGQLGDGTTIDRTTPVQVVGLDGLTGDTEADLIAAGEKSVCAVMESGAVLCWGANDHGQLGNGTTVDSSIPVLVANIGPSVDLRVMSLSVGKTSVCVTTEEDGAIHCWGANDQGQLGNGTTAESHMPVKVDFPFDSDVGFIADSVSVGDKFACASVIRGFMQLTMSVSTYCWGDNAYGQLGDGTVVDRWRMTPVLQGVVGTTLDSAGPGPTAPDAPVDLVVSNRSAGTLGVTWSLPAQQGGAAVTGYVISWVRTGQTQRPGDSTVVSRRQTRLRVSNLVAGASYTFSVRAINDVGRSAPARISGIVPVRAPAPMVTRDVWKKRVITLWWEGVGTPRHSPVLGYVVSCQAGDGETFRTSVGPVARNADVQVPIDRLYSCRVAGVTAAGRGVGSVRITVGPRPNFSNQRIKMQGELKSVGQA